MRNAHVTITAIMQQNVTEVMTMRSCNIIITAARTDDSAVLDVIAREIWEMLKIHALPIMQLIE